ncbi:hypothetical protein ACHQM5_026585 [Ranunculus cassubicifolius]
MDLTPFKLDIDELINEFAECNSTTLADMKRIWMSRKFTFIYEARPTTNVAYFMQSLFAHSISYMLCATSLSERLGGLYSLYCLHETQPFRPPFKIYLSLGELKRLKNLVVEAKEVNIKVVPALVKKMYEQNVYLFGSVEMNDSSVSERLNEIMKLQNARVQVAYDKLLANTPIEPFLDMDLGMELDLKSLKKFSKEYAISKQSAIEEAGKVVDVQNIKHIAETKKPFENLMKKVVEDWKTQRDIFSHQTGYTSTQQQDNEHNNEVCYQQQQVNGDNHAVDGEEEVDEFGKELELLLA